MIRQLRRMLFTIALSWIVSLSQLSADDKTTTLETAIVDGLTVREQLKQLRRARRIIRDCDQIVEAMIEHDRQGLVSNDAAFDEFVQTNKPVIQSLVKAGSDLKPPRITTTAGQIPEVTNIVMIALGYKGSNAFDTMVRLYEEDRREAIHQLDEHEQRLPRKWANRTGTSSVIAEMVSLQKDTVVLRRLDDGREVTVPRDKLSLIDRRFLNRWQQGNFDAVGELKEIGIDRQVPFKGSSD